jgi:hypothetical protein
MTSAVFRRPTFERDSDPTQPAIDSKLTNQGSDMVFEPMANITRSSKNTLDGLT